MPVCPRSHQVGGSGRKGLEGLVAKRRGDQYEDNSQRSGALAEGRLNQGQEFVIERGTLLADEPSMR